jgi:hypothetical protein
MLRFSAHSAGAFTKVIIDHTKVYHCQLMFLDVDSGIGPEKHLKDMGIPVIHKLDGVGVNLVCVIHGIFRQC